MSNWSAVAKVVNERMAERGISQRQLAEISGVSVATLRQIQQGADRRRSVVTLGAVSRALGFPEDYLRRVALEASQDSPNDTSRSSTSIAELRTEVEDLRRRVAAIEARLELAGR